MITNEAASVQSVGKTVMIVDFGSQLFFLNTFRQGNNIQGIMNNLDFISIDMINKHSDNQDGKQRRGKF